MVQCNPHHMEQSSSLNIIVIKLIDIPWYTLYSKWPEAWDPEAQMLYCGLQEYPFECVQYTHIIQFTVLYVPEEAGRI
jgi:hypothetical protein